MREYDCNYKEKDNFILCPICSQKGIKVKTITLKALIKEKSTSQITPESNYYYCSSNKCPIVYFNHSLDSLFYEKDIKVKIGEKSNIDGYICFCFSITIEDLINNNSIKLKIIDQIRNKNCNCEIKNIKGKCCLSDINNFLYANSNSSC